MPVVYRPTVQTLVKQLSAVVGAFPRRAISRARVPFRTDRDCGCFYVCSWLKCYSLGMFLMYVNIMCCNIMYASLSANSQGMLPRAHGAQKMMFTIPEVFVDYPNPVSVTLCL